MNTLGYVIVFVSDMDKSVAFYRDVLGFPVKHQSHKWTGLGSLRMPVGTYSGIQRTTARKAGDLMTVTKLPRYGPP
jgi:catechol 2,3-dioxygenase-like lactoylglutathione lyase family enzyme